MELYPAKALKEEALLSLKLALQDSRDPEGFLSEADNIVRNPAMLLDIPFDSGNPDPLYHSKRGTGIDALNAQMVYEFLGPMTRTNASDPRLWTYLAFCSYRPYMEQRWPLTNKQWKGRVEDRWLMLAPRRSALVRHGIARLWWAAYLTHDPQLKRPLSAMHEDPFTYTNIAFAREDAFLQLFDRDIASMPELLFGLLEHLAADEANTEEKYVRRIAREAVREYAYREVSLLPGSAIGDVVRELSASARASVSSD